jgi:hypothetical protein
MLDNSEKLLLQTFANETKEKILRYRYASETLPISFFYRSKSTSSHLNGDFLWFQFFIEIILRMGSMSNAMNDLIAMCTQVYKGNNVEQDNIREFQSNCSATDAIKWCTRMSCINLSYSFCFYKCAYWIRRLLSVQTTE